MRRSLTILPGFAYPKLLCAVETWRAFPAVIVVAVGGAPGYFVTGLVLAPLFLKACLGKFVTASRTMFFC